jgi:hypothetical protein
VHQKLRLFCAYVNVFGKPDYVIEYANRESLGQLRAILQRGLETVRSVGSSGLDVELLIHLARTFNDRVSFVNPMFLITHILKYQ